MVKDPINFLSPKESHGQGQACVFSTPSPFQPHTGQGTQNTTTCERMNK